jgi:hypothetical protein
MKLLHLKWSIKRPMRVLINTFLTDQTPSLMERLIRLSIDSAAYG